jgi:hypothetical protein
MATATLNETAVCGCVRAVLGREKPDPSTPDRPADVECQDFEGNTYRIWFTASDAVTVSRAGREWVDDGISWTERTATARRPGIEAKIRGLIGAPTAAPRLVRCDCGHDIPAGLVMSASLGTSCSACYDRMSD